VQGAWQLWDRLRAAFPDVEIEACAAGGGRIDAGFAVRAHRFWTSDNIDALSRVEIQRGFLQFMPPELMGAHVGASPAHATGRPQSLDFSAMIALPGHFGVECDPGKLTEQERARLTGWIDIYKTLREHFHRGRCWMGEGTDGVTWQAHGDDSALLVLASRTQPGVHAREGPLRLPMLRGDKAMRVRLLHFAGLAGDRQPPFIEAARTEGVILSSSWLSAHGLSLPQMGSPGAVLFSVERL
jgi:alpha-galactosidase